MFDERSVADRLATIEAAKNPADIAWLVATIRYMRASAREIRQAHVAPCCRRCGNRCGVCADARAVVKTSGATMTAR